MFPTDLHDKVKRMMDRRIFLERCAAAGLGSTLLPGALAAMAVQSATAQASSDGPKAEAPAITSFSPITAEMLDAAAAIAGITLSAEQKTMMLDGVHEQRAGLQAIRDLHIPNSVAPAMVFHPMPVGYKMPFTSDVHPPAKQYAVPTIDAEEKLAFASIGELGALLRSRKMSSVEMTRFFLSRTHALDAKLHLLVTPTAERALAQAAQVDKDISAGKYRGGLHGVPWGAKDLLSVKGYRTTWGAGGMETQQFEEDATVVQRLDAAGAILISKLTLGALAQGDVWFGGKTRNPWNIKQGSSGSSAGPASAVSAGCCAFAIGSETLGSISSPSTRCGVTGLRPTFGFVPRTGAMALSWSMDKLGPIARSAEDAAMVMAAIHGADGSDTSCISPLFDRDTSVNLASLRVGYLEGAFAEPVLRTPDASAEKPESEAQRRESAQQRQQAFERQRYDNRYDRATLDVLRGMGVQLIPVKLPDLPFSSISKVLSVEAAAAFDEITRNGRVNLLTAQSANDWPNQFRTARMYSGVDYVQAMRARTMLIAQMGELFRTVDIIVTPSGGPQLTATNLSGHPAVIVPNGLRGKDAPLPQDTTDGGRTNVGGPGTPVSITFLGKLYDDATVLAFAQRYQEKTGFHKLHPRVG
jgi:Asp-tRNA(Asn)/Glu-tRNA(Gln) amidotransferase A subunit family amidase